jgi:phosphoglycolate phosphatase
MKYKAVLFDLDGTLIDSIEDLMDSMNDVLEKYNYPLHSVEDYKYFVGNGIEQLIIRALPQNVSDNDEFVLKIVKEYRDEYNKKWHDKSKPYEGIPELLSILEKLGLSMVVFSNKADYFTQKIIKHFFPDNNFKIILGARENFPNKPDPAGALEISRSLNIPPDSFLYLGDTNTDMQTANAAGMFPVGVLWGFRKKDELIENGAKELISHPLELLEIINRKK